MTESSEKGKLQDVLQLVDDALEEENLEQVRSALTALHPSEIADLLEALPAKDRELVWDQIDPALEGDVLAYAQDDVRAGLLGKLAPHEVAAVTRDLDTDDAADILQDLPETVIDEVLWSMDDQHRRRLTAVLSYPEDTAGGLMNLDTITVRCDVDLDVVVRYLRLRGSLPEKTDALMVVDRQNRYLGMLGLADLLTGNPDVTVGEVMQTDIEGLPAVTPAGEVAKLFERRDLLSAPVVDEQGCLLGRITVDDVVDVIQSEAGRSWMARGGLTGDDDMFAPVIVSARRRAIWLGVNLLTAFLASWVIGQFEATIQRIVAVAVLMPIVASMGGIAGTQTLTVVIRGLALGQVGSANARALLWKEVAVGVLNGLLWAVVVGVVAYLWFHDLELGVIIGLAMIINLLNAALNGILIPLGLKWLHIDPALAGGVILTTATDVVGFSVFLGLATLLLT